MTEAVFYDHEVVRRAPDDYIELQLPPETILKAWSVSMFAHEVLNKDGTVKDNSQMNEATLTKYLSALDSFKRGEEVAKPVIGIGIMDNIEIGIGREIIAAGKSLSLATIPVHIRQNQAKDIKQLLKA